MLQRMSGSLFAYCPTGRASCMLSDSVRLVLVPAVMGATSGDDLPINAIWGRHLLVPRIMTLRRKYNSGISRCLKTTKGTVRTFSRLLFSQSASISSLDFMICEINSLRDYNKRFVRPERSEVNRCCRRHRRTFLRRNDSQADMTAVILLCRLR